MGDEFFEFAFDRGITNMFVLEHAVGVNRESMRNRVDTEHPDNRPTEGTVAILRPGHFILHDEVFPFLLFGIQAHAED